MVQIKNLKIWKGWQVWVIKDDNGKLLGYYGKNFKVKRGKKHAKLS